MSLLALNRTEEAAIHFKKHNTEKSQSYLLRCYYLLNNRELFEAQLQNILDKGFANAIIGAVCGDAGLAFNKSIENPFCSKPMEFILTGDIIAKYAFGKTFDRNKWYFDVGFIAVSTTNTSNKWKANCGEHIF